MYVHVCWFWLPFLGEGFNRMDYATLLNFRIFFSEADIQIFIFVVGMFGIFKILQVRLHNRFENMRSTYSLLRLGNCFSWIYVLNIELIKIQFKYFIFFFMHTNTKREKISFWKEIRKFSASRFERTANFLLYNDSQRTESSGSIAFTFVFFRV